MNNKINDSVGDVYNDHISPIMDVLTSLPIPGFSDFLSPLQSLLNIFLGDQTLEQILQEVTEINQKIDNMHNVITYAINKNELEDSRNTIVTHAKDIEIDLFNKHLIDDLWLERLTPNIKAIYKEMLMAICQGHQCLRDYTDAQKHKKGNLSDYIDGYNFAVTIVTEAFLITQGTFDRILQHIEKKSQGFGCSPNWQALITDINKRTSDINIEIKSFLNNDILKYYPKWLVPMKENCLKFKNIFASEYVMDGSMNKSDLEDRVYEHHANHGGYQNWILKRGTEDNQKWQIIHEKDSSHLTLVYDESEHYSKAMVTLTKNGESLKKSHLDEWTILYENNKIMICNEFTYTYYSRYAGFIKQTKDFQVCTQRLSTELEMCIFEWDETDGQWTIESVSD